MKFQGQRLFLNLLAALQQLLDVIIIEQGEYYLLDEVGGQLFEFDIGWAEPVDIGRSVVHGQQRVNALKDIIFAGKKLILLKLLLQFGPIFSFEFL